MSAMQEAEVTNRMVVRFLGDPTGYRVPMEQFLDSHLVDAKGHPRGWVDAFIGRTTKRVRIDLDKAYVVELDPDE